MSDPSESRPTCHVSNFNADATCDECGVVGSYLFGDVKLCTDCYAGKGSCCPEFGKDDLWRIDEPPFVHRDGN